MVEGGLKRVEPGPGSTLTPHLCPPTHTMALKPLMRRPEIELLGQYARGARNVLEFGSGGSTVLFGQAGVERVWSVETSAEWAQRVQRAYAELGLDARTRLVMSGMGVLGPTTEGGGYPVRVDGGSIRDWCKLSAVPPGVPRGELDLVFVDGRFRVACALRVLLEGVLRPGSGVLAVHDFTNADRRHNYRVLLKHVEVVVLKQSLLIAKPLPEYSAEQRAVMTDLLTVAETCPW